MNKSTCINNLSCLCACTYLSCFHCYHNYASSKTLTDGYRADTLEHIHVLLMFLHDH